MYIYITTVYGYRYLTWCVSGRLNALEFGEYSISVIELLYNILINKKYISFYLYLIAWILIYNYWFHAVFTWQLSAK